MLIFTGILLVAANLRAALTTVGPVVTDIQDDLDISSSAASFLISLPLLAFAAVSPFVPRLARRIGLERVIAVGLVMLAVGLVIRSTPPTALLWVGTVLIGTAIAILNVVLPSWVKRDFPLKIGQVTGTYSAVQSGVAAIAAGVAVPVAGLGALGWRLPLAMWAGLALIALGVLLPLLRTGSAASTGRTETNVPDELPGDAAPDASAPSTPGTASTATRALWRSPLAWQVATFMGLQSTTYYVMVTWLSTIEKDAGISGTTAGTHQFLFNACGIIGNLGCSALIARSRDQRLIGATIPLFLLVASIGMLIAPSLAGLWAVLSGAGCGACIVLSLSLFGLRSRHHTTAASLSGLAQSFGYVLAAIGPITVGALHDATDSWTPGLVILVVLNIVLVGAGYLAGRDRTVD